MVIGWSQTPPIHNPITGALRRAMGWEAWVLHETRIHRIEWGMMGDQLTFEEWEALR